MFLTTRLPRSGVPSKWDSDAALEVLGLGCSGEFQAGHSSSSSSSFFSDSSLIILLEHWVEQDFLLSPGRESKFFCTQRRSWGGEEDQDQRPARSDSPQPLLASLVGWEWLTAHA